MYRNRNKQRQKKKKVLIYVIEIYSISVSVCHVKFSNDLLFSDDGEYHSPQARNEL